MKKFLLIIFTAAIAGAGGWFAAKNESLFHAPGTETAAAATGPKILFYQSPMHPWIKADKPGKCTICGMNLVAVYEGDKGFEAKPDVVVLSKDNINVLNVRTTTVMKAPLMRTLRFAGTIDDNDTRHRIVSAYMAGRIDKLYANVLGAEFKENEPLMEIYSPTLLEAEREYAQIYNTHIGNAATLEGARQKLLLLGLRPSQIDALPKKPVSTHTSQVLAPMGGIIVKKMVYEGQRVEEGAPLLEIGDFSIMWMVFRAYEQDLPFLKVGQEVEITSPSMPGEVIRAPITFIDPNLDDATRSAKIRVDVPNPNHRLRHRIYAEARVNATTPVVLQVPRLAVLSPGDKPIVYKEVSEGAYERTAVKLGRLGDDAWELKDGLVEGDKIVMTGNLMIDSQAQINDSIAAPEKPQEPEPAPAKAEETRAATKPWPLAVCPVSGEKLGDMGPPLVFVINGQEVKLCCKTCKPDFDKKPAQYLAKISPHA